MLKFEFPLRQLGLENQ